VTTIAVVSLDPAAPNERRSRRRLLDEAMSGHGVIELVLGMTYEHRVDEPLLVAELADLVLAGWRDP